MFLYTVHVNSLCHYKQTHHYNTASRKTNQEVCSVLIRRWSHSPIRALQTSVIVLSHMPIHTGVNELKTITFTPSLVTLDITHSLTYKYVSTLHHRVTETHQQTQQIQEVTSFTLYVCTGLGCLSSKSLGVHIRQSHVTKVTCSCFSM